MTTITVSIPHQPDWRILFQKRDVAWLWGGQVVAQAGDKPGTMAPLGLAKNLMARMFGAFHSGVHGLGSHGQNALRMDRGHFPRERESFRCLAARRRRDYRGLDIRVSTS